MKKLFATACALLFFNGSLLLVGALPARAADQVPVILTERPHMGLDGTFYDDQLEIGRAHV